MNLQPTSFPFPAQNAPFDYVLRTPRDTSRPKMLRSPPNRFISRLGTFSPETELTSAEHLSKHSTILITDPLEH